MCRGRLYIHRDEHLRVAHKGKIGDSIDDTEFVENVTGFKRSLHPHAMIHTVRKQENTNNVDTARLY